MTLPACDGINKRWKRSKGKLRSANEEGVPSPNGSVDSSSVLRKPWPDYVSCGHLDEELSLSRNPSKHHPNVRQEVPIIAYRKTGEEVPVVWSTLALVYSFT